MAPRSYPSVKKLWYTDRKGVRRQTETYFINYSYRGKRIREKTGLKDARAAYDLLLQRRQECRIGRLIGPKADRVTLQTLEQLVIDNYKAEGRRTPEAKTRYRFRPIHEFFKGAKPLHITPADLTAYIVHRRERVSLGSISIELANLQRGYTLAVKSKMLPESPQFPRLKLDNARKVFIDRPTLEALLEHLPEDIRPIFEVGLLTGWRKEAILSRERKHVDLRNRWLILDGRWSKNGQPVTVPLNRPLRAILLMQERKARQIERATGRIIPWVFFHARSDLANVRRGDQIKDFSGAFAAAKKAAGIPNVHFHDLRRGAIRTLRRAGVSEHEIMEWVGLKTRSVFDRYDVIDEERKRETGAKLEAYYAEEGKRQNAVVPFKKADSR